MTDNKNSGLVALLWWAFRKTAPGLQTVPLGFDGADYGPVTVDGDGHLQVDILSGSSASTEFDDGDTIDTDSQGTLIMGVEGGGGTNLPGTARAIATDSDGHVQVDILSGGGGSGNLIDTNNSTASTLAGDATFTGTATDVTEYTAAYIYVFSDVDSADDGIQLQTSNDGTNWDHEHTYTYLAGGGKHIEFSLAAQYFRVVYTNGSSGQSSFRLQTKLLGGPSSPHVHPIEFALDGTHPAAIVRSIIGGLDINTGDYLNLYTYSGSGGNFLPTIPIDALGRTQVFKSGTGESYALVASTDDTPGNASYILVDGDGHPQIDVLSSALPSGAATAANQSTANSALSAIQAAVEIMDDWNESDRAKVNPIAGQAGVQGGSGAVTALTQRMVLATDVPLPAGTNNIGDVDVLSTPESEPSYVKGKLDAADIDSAYAEVVDPDGDIKVAVLSNSSDEGVIVSFDGGSTDHLELDRYESVVLDFKGNEFVESGVIDAKSATGGDNNHNVGSFRVTILK